MHFFLFQLYLVWKSKSQPEISNTNKIDLPLPNFAKMGSPNPWVVENIEAFSFYCCPECDFKSKDKEYFKRHAMESHNKSKIFFTMPKSKNDTNIDSIEVATESECQDENFMEDFDGSETSVKEEPLSESEGEELVRLSEDQALKLINGPDYITQEDLETFVEDNVKTFDEHKSKCNNTFDEENFENITDAETSDDETFDGMETYDETENFDVIDVEINDINIAASVVKQNLNISLDLESEGDIEKANTLIEDNSKITEEQKNVIIVAFKSNEEKAKTFIEANYAITEEEKNIILDAIRNNITNEMTTHKKEEVNLSEDNPNAIETELSEDDENDTQANEKVKPMLAVRKVEKNKKNRSYENKKWNKHFEIIGNYIKCTFKVKPKTENETQNLLQNCGSKFKVLSKNGKSNFYQHCRRNHDKEDVRTRFPCSFGDGSCTKSYQQKYSMEQHVMFDHLGQAKECDYCPKTFKHLTQYFNHRKNAHPEVLNDKNSA